MIIENAFMFFIAVFGYDVEFMVAKKELGIERYSL